jgi:hypothetical protein
MTGFQLMKHGYLFEGFPMTPSSAPLRKSSLRHILEVGTKESLHGGQPSALQCPVRSVTDKPRLFEDIEILGVLF